MKFVFLKREHSTSYSPQFPALVCLHLTFSAYDTSNKLFSFQDNYLKSHSEKRVNQTRTLFLLLLLSVLLPTIIKFAYKHNKKQNFIEQHNTRKQKYAQFILHYLYIIYAAKVCIIRQS